MEKNWFIFKGDHHLGPFSSEDLVRMLQHEKARQEDLIWREGESDWIELGKHPALLAYFEPPIQEEQKTKTPQEKFILKEPVKEAYVDDFLEVVEEKDLPPPLPPLPDFDEPFVEEPLVKETLKFEPEIEEEGPPPLPPLPIVEEPASEETTVEVIEAELVQEQEPILDLSHVEEVEKELPTDKLIFDEFTLDHDEFDEDEDEEDPTREFPVPEGLWEEAPPWQKTMMISSLVIGLLMSLHFFTWDSSSVEATRFSGVSRSQKREMIKVVNTSYKIGVRAKLALSNTGNEIWLATNQPGEAILYLSLKSIKDRIINANKEVIELRSTGELLKGGAKFRNLELVTGEKIAEGEYEASLTGYATGWKSRLANFLKKYSLFKDFKFVTKFKPEFKLNLPFLYSIKPVSEFERLLDGNKKKAKLDLAKPYQELMERHKTFSGLLSNIQNMYKESLKTMSKGRDVRLFERRYAMEVEPILRDLLLDSNRRHIALMNEDKRRSEDFLKLVDEGKQIGILVSDIVTRTRKYGRLNKKKRVKLAGIFAPRIEEILKTSKEDELRLESEMKRVLAD